MINTIPALVLFLLPLTASPGPANLLLAAGGAAFGWRRTFPFFLGILGVFLGQSLLFGAGVGELLQRWPALLRFFQIAGAVYLLYLAYHFFQMRTIEEREAQRLGWREGVVLQLLNFKALVVYVLLFTQFLDPDRPVWPQILFLTAVLLVVGSCSGFTWLVGGSGLGRLLRSERGALWQGRIFGVMLVVVAIWMLLRH